MSIDREGWILSREEICAIASLVGMEQFVGFTGAQDRPLQEQDLLNACCALIRDRMMTQIDGKYRLSRGLAEVMQPVCTARTVLVLTPGIRPRGRRMYYIGQGVTAMEQTLRGFALTRLERDELADALWEHMELESEPKLPQPLPEPPAPAGASASRDSLLRDSLCLLERLDAASGSPSGWLQLRRDNWLEWTVGGLTHQAWLSRGALAGAVSMMLEER